MTTPTDNTQRELGNLQAEVRHLASNIANLTQELKDQRQVIKEQQNDHELRIRRAERAILVLAAGAGSAAAKIFGLL